MSHDIPAEKCTILAHLYELPKNICKMSRFFFMVELSQDVCSFWKGYKGGFTMGIRKSRSKRQLEDVGHFFSGLPKAENFVSLFER
jgi:hypothetical protein